ncbi:MAG: hypothetical protein ACI9F2_000263 [Lysobacterales bacterium]|jgi:hypothetical protein
MSSTTQFISVRETAQILEITENKVMELIEVRTLQAYRIADKFLRLKKSDVLGLRNDGSVIKETASHAYTSAERLKDFLYFNDFYIFVSIVILSLLYIVFYV